MTEQRSPATRPDYKRQAPELAKAMAALENAVEFDPALRELIRLRASQINGCAYCVDRHWSHAASAGETARRLHAVVVWHEAPFFTGRERAALALCEAVTLISEDQVPDRIWDEASKHFDDNEITQLLFAIITINAYNRLAISTGMQPPVGN